MIARLETHVPGDDLTDDAQRLMTRESHLPRPEVDVLTVILVSPSSIVSNDMCGFQGVETSGDLGVDVKQVEPRSVIDHRGLGRTSRWVSNANADVRNRPFRYRASRVRRVRRRALR